jgi:hypothetical protein
LRSSTVCLIIASIFLIFTLSACGSFINPGITPTPYGAVPLASQFRDLYDKLGGEPALGQSISPTFAHNGLLCQYTENVLMCFNPAATVDVDRLVLIPVGTMLVTPSVGEPPMIYAGFQDMYDRLYGERYVGKPLSGVRFNTEKRRIEQYFENMGFYQLIDDSRGIVHLMAYGSFVCREFCAYQPYTGSAIIGWDKGVEVPGATSLARLGGFDIFGSPISKPYISPIDGTIEQVLENVVIYIPKDNPTTIHLRPLSLILQMQQEAPGPQIYGLDQGMVFYPVQGALGFHVPVVFDRFIIDHGSTEISGKPIMDPFSVDVNGVKIARQCFENYCLDYDSTAAESKRIHMVGLGSQYLKQKVNEENWVFQFSPKTTVLKISKLKPQISAKEEQVIQVNVYQVNGHLPMSDIDAVLLVGLPDGSKVTYNVPPTNLEGTITVTIPAITNAVNGTVVPYIVCLNVPSDTQICQSDSYLIWNDR